MKRTMSVLLAMLIALMPLFAAGEAADVTVDSSVVKPVVDLSGDSSVVKPFVELEGDGDITPTPEEEIPPLTRPVPDAIITVGSTTQMSGNFFSDMWGNNTADMDVRALIHGYQTVAWTREGAYQVDNVVVREMTATLNDRGDKTYRFALNKNLTYNDETPINAKDYVFTVLLSSCPEVRELGAMNKDYSHLWGFDDYDQGRGELFAGVHLIDDYTFTLTIPADYLPYFYELALVNVRPTPISVVAPGCDVADDGDGCYIVDPTEEEIEAAAEEGILLEPFSAELLDRTMLLPEWGYVTYPEVTCGPYNLTGYDAETHEASFEINEMYLGNFEGKKPEMETLYFKQVTNDTAIEQFAAGEVQILNKLSDGDVIDAALQMVTEETAQTVNYLRSGFGFITFACEEQPTNSVKVRQAVALCMNVDQYCDSFLKGYALPVYGYYGYGQWMANQNQQALAELNVYGYDPVAAEALIEEDGWIYDEQGEVFEKGADTVRYKRLSDDELIPLTLRWAKTPGTASDEIRAMIEADLGLIGFDLQITEMSFSEMLAHYYRQVDREYNMFFLATNFGNIYDPYSAMNGAADYQGVHNTTGIDDAELLRLADDLRHTEATDLVGYAEKFILFQKRFSEVLPMVPIYSNIYFDVYMPGLYGYDVNAYFSWGAAMLYATFTPPVEEAPVTEETGDLVTIE